MPILIIHDKPISLPDSFHEGDLLTQAQAQILNNLFLERFLSLLRNQVFKLKDEDYNPEVLVQTISDRVDLDSDPSGTSPIQLEALAIARELILQRLAADDLPTPPNLETHAETLVRDLPQILEQAKIRIDIRKSVAQEMIANLEGN